MMCNLHFSIKGQPTNIGHGLLFIQQHSHVDMVYKTHCISTPKSYLPPPKVSPETMRSPNRLFPSPELHFNCTCNSSIDCYQCLIDMITMVMV